MLSQSSLVLQKMMARSIFICLMAQTVYSPFNIFTASDSISESSKIVYFIKQKPIREIALAIRSKAFWEIPKNHTGVGNKRVLLCGLQDIFSMKCRKVISKFLKYQT